MNITEYERAKFARSVVLNRAAEVIAYDSWSDEFARKELRKELPKDAMDIDPYELTMEQMKDLGFARWNYESDLMLIPLWLLPFLKEDIETESISGNKYSKKSELDTDNRYGCIAFGVYPKKEEPSE